MGQLTNQYVSQSYQGLLKLEDSTTGVTGTLQYVQDGLGNNLPMLASTSSIVITGSFRGDGSGLTGVTLDSSSLVTTSSFNAFTSSYYVDSGSFDQRIDGIIAGTGSYVTVPDFNVYTSSIDNTLNSLETATGSLQLQINSKLDTGSFNAYTSSNDSKVNALISVTGSYATTSSLSTLSGSIATTDLGQNNRLSSLETTTGSLQLQINQKLNTGSFNSYTSSNDTKVNDLISKTGSYVTETESGSFVTSVTGSSATITVTKGNGTTNTVTVNNVTNATSASFAQNAVSSSFATNATSASFAQNAISSSFAQNAVTASIASDLTVRGKCDVLAGLTKGTIVRINGADGNNPTFTTASWENDNNSANTIGILNSNVAYNGFADIIVQGTIIGINTDGMTAGAMLYLSSSGQYTTTIPPAPYHEVRLGQVLRPQLNNGSAYISIDNGYELSELHDVDITAPAVGDVLTYVSGSYGQWVNKTGTELGYASTGSNTFNATQVISGSLYVTDTLYATSASFTYVTSSQVVVSGNTIAVNIGVPAQRFGGLVAYDSGSSNATASLLWDSQRDHWVYENVSGAMYSGAGLISGPRNTGSLGDEPYPTLNTITRGQGGDHIYDSNITDNDTVITMKIKTDVSGSLSVTGGITGSLQGNASTATSASHAAQAVSSSHSLNSNTAISSSFTTNAVSSSYSNTAVSSSFAQNAVSSSHSVNSDNSISSSFAQNAISSSYSTNAGTSVSSSFATNAGTAVSSSYSQNSDNSVSSSFATNATSASFAQNAVSASYAPSTSTDTGSLVQTVGLLSPTTDTIQVTKGDGTLSQFTINNVSSSISSSYAVTASYSPFAEAAVTASYALNANINSGSFATTGSNVFRGDQYISGSADISGSLFLRLNGIGSSLIGRDFSYLTSSLTAGGNIFFQDVTTTSTVSQSLIVSSSNNIIFNRPASNSTTYDSVLPGNQPGGSNIFSVPPQLSVTNRGQNIPITMRNNLGRGTTGPFLLTFTTGSVTGSALVEQNIVAGTINYLGSQIGRMPTISNNSVAGQLTYNASTLGYAMQNSNAPLIIGNIINGASVTVSATSGSLQFSYNNINGNASIRNFFTAGANSGSQYVIADNNNIGNNPSITMIGTSNQNQPRTVKSNLIQGYNITVTGRNELTVSGSINNSLIVGDNLLVTASHRDNAAAFDGSSTFIGRYNATGSFVSDSAQTIFAVGTGTALNNRRTSLHVSSSGLFSVRDGLELSGSFNVTGSSVITGSIQGNVLPLTVTSNTASLNLNNGNFFELALTGSQNIRIEPSNIKPGQTINLKLNTTGSGTVSFPSSVKQVSGSSYVPSTGTTTDIVTLVSFDSTNLYLANVKNLI